MISKQCPKCKGEGGFNRGRKKTIGLSEFFSGNTGWVRCELCNGSGQNPKYKEKRCEYCSWGVVAYSSDSQNPPRYCSESCKQSARREQEQHRQAEREKNHSQQRSYEQRSHDRPSNSGWLEKYCPGASGQGYCGNTIRYKSNWSDPPQYCDTCKNKEFEKLCANSSYGCDRKIKYKVFWKDIPNKCGRCKKEEERGSYPRKCDSCGGIMFVGAGKAYTTCFDCNQRKQAEQHKARRHNVPGRSINVYANTPTELTHALLHYVNSSDDIFFVELGGMLREMWKLPPKERGKLADQAANRGNLTYNFPVIDEFTEQGEITSVKSLDLSAKSYKSINDLDRKLSYYIDQLSKYEGTQKGGWGGVDIPKDRIKSRSLLLIVPLMGSSDQQLSYLYTLHHGYARNKNVRLIVFVVD